MLPPIPKINLTARLKEIRYPSVIIVGKQDPATPVAMAQEIQQAMPGSSLVIIPDTAHLSNMEQPEAFSQALAGFLAKAGKEAFPVASSHPWLVTPA